MRFLTVLCLALLVCLCASQALACNPGVPVQAQFAPSAYDPGCVPAQSFVPQRAFFQAAPQYGYGTQAAFFPQQRFVRQRGFFAAPGGGYGVGAAPLVGTPGGINVNVNSGNAVQRRGLFGLR